MITKLKLIKNNVEKRIEASKKEELFNIQLLSNGFSPSKVVKLIVQHRYIQTFWKDVLDEINDSNDEISQLDVISRLDYFISKRQDWILNPSHKLMEEKTNPLENLESLWKQESEIEELYYLKVMIKSLW